MEDGQKALLYNKYTPIIIAQSQIYCTDNQWLVFPPHHFIYDTDIALDDFHDFGGDVFVHVVGDRDAVIAVAAEFDCGIYCLEQRLGVDAGDDEISLVDSLGALGAGTYAYCRERMTYACEEAAFFWKRAAIAHHCKCIHLQAVVVMES